MALATLLTTQSLTILGLNSGTSADGLDLAVLRVGKSPRKRAIAFLHGSRRTYPAAVRREVLRLVDSPTVSLAQIIQVDNLLGQFFGRAAAAYIRQLKAKGIRVDAVASHGQTVYHLPKKEKLAGFSVNGTLQLGSLEQIAAATGTVTVGDFRQADVALGNEGAPITVAAMQRLFGHPNESRLILNVGGMANFFYLPAGTIKGVLAADTGPGNSLSDLLSQDLFGEPYDRNGRHARAGTCSKRLLSWVLALPFFHGGTLSTGREVFGARLAQELVAEGKRLGVSREDLLATAVEVTARAVRARVQPIIRRDPSIKKLYLTGGGVRNSFMRERLAAVLPEMEIGSVQELGYDPSLVEASSYAVMGAACLRSEALPTRFTGQRQTLRPVLGKIVQPPSSR